MVAVFLMLALTGCGEERWAVKVANDAAASQVKEASPIKWTVAKLRELSMPQWHDTRPREGAEFLMVQVDVVLKAIRGENDGDLHLIIADVDLPDGPTMIAEVPEYGCADDSPFQEQMKAALEALKDIRPGMKLQLTGIIFFDRIHNQKGLAPNGVELHPLTKVVKL